MFREHIFSVFNEPDVEERLKLVRTQIDPFFEEAIQEVLPILNGNGETYRAFIAKHARRHSNPPPNTWVAFAQNKRGYKMVPHYEIGVWDDRLFVWLAFETNMQERQSAIDKLKSKQAGFLNLGAQFKLSNNHMAKSFISLTKGNFEKSVKEYRFQKKAEVLIGRVLQKDNRNLDSKAAVLEMIEQAISVLSKIWDN